MSKSLNIAKSLPAHRARPSTTDGSAIICNAITYLPNINSDVLTLLLILNEVCSIM